MFVKGDNTIGYFRSNYIGLVNRNTYSFLSIWCDGSSFDGIMELSDGNKVIELNPSGTSYFPGSLSVSGSKNRVVDVENKKVLLYAYETTTPYFGDIGSNKTDENGYCKIYIENIFSQTIEKEEYKVFIQECGDGHLFIKKFNNYFEVLGTPNLEFDWEIKAIQKGYKNVRLEEFKERRNDN